MFDYSKFFWYLWAFIVAYTVLTLVYVGVYVQNNSPLYTWFSNLGAPGATLVSFRGTATDVLIRLATMGHVMAVALVLLLIITRENAKLSILWYVLFALGWFFSLLAVASMGTHYSAANGQEQYGNMFNDLRYCCPVEIQSNPRNGCPNPLPCTEPTTVLLSELRPNVDAVGLFWFNFVLFMLQMGFLAGMGYLMFFGGGKKAEDGDDDGKEDDNGEEMGEAKKVPPPPEPTPSAPPPPIIPPSGIVMAGAKVHGLRQRRN